ncbi:hypothetical protein BDN71DRAFT_1435960 [Pleurotus eryngii]|uniref:Uncharacterized protein n=1 Tax=Pleurotus eryngii TaxID=5323 RepID=A0A9P5ZMV0_PLEER|nr:hypothetical protein BDN71DRAFT_1435960 [Pleurotus eryngii]
MPELGHLRPLRESEASATRIPKRAIIPTWDGCVIASASSHTLTPRASSSVIVDAAAAAAFPGDNSRPACEISLLMVLQQHHDLPHHEVASQEDQAVEKRVIAGVELKVEVELVVEESTLTSHQLASNAAIAQDAAIQQQKCNPTLASSIRQSSLRSPEMVPSHHPASHSHAPAKPISQDLLLQCSTITRQINANYPATTQDERLTRSFVAHDLAAPYTTSSNTHLILYPSGVTSQDYASVRQRTTAEYQPTNPIYGRFDLIVSPLIVLNETHCFAAQSSSLKHVICPSTHELLQSVSGP